MRDENGDVVYDHRAKTPRIPASNEKLVTEFAALDTLGARHTFETRVARRGAVSAGVLRGDLYLIGDGDPMLATAAYARTAFVTPVATVDRLARDVKAAGIRRVTGGVLGDGSRFDRLRAGRSGSPGSRASSAPRWRRSASTATSSAASPSPSRSSPPRGRCGPR